MMAIHIGLLRAVNLPGHNKVGMSQLHDLLTGLGMEDVQTVLQSGNLVFRSDVSTTTRLERVLEDAAATHLGFETDFFVRTARDWKAVVAGNPFTKEAERDPSHLLIVFLKQAPERAAVAALQQAIRGRETVRIRGREAYITYPDGVGRSKLTSLVIERHLGTRGTARNWNTVMKLAVLAEVTVERRS